MTILHTAREHIVKSDIYTHLQAAGVAFDGLIINVEQADDSTYFGTLAFLSDQEAMKAFRPLIHIPGIRNATRNLWTIRFIYEAQS